MPAAKKVWVIDAEPVVRKKRHASAGRSAFTADRSLDSSVEKGLDRSGQVSSTASSRRKPSVLHVFAAYTLGSASPFIVQHSTHGGIWAAVAIASVSIWSFVVSQWDLMQAAFSHGWLPFHVWLVAMCLISLAGITSWSRAILIVGGAFSGGSMYSNRCLRSSLAVGLLGLAVPGLGLMLAGKPRRAALAAWIAGMLTLSVLMLWRAGALWEAHQQSASAGLDPLRLEKILVASTMAALLGGVAWIINAYDGARVANRIPLRASMQGPWWAVALLVSSVAFFITFDPAARARDLDNMASSMREAGLQYIPLHVQLASLRLDPSNLGYRIQVADLYEELGRKVDAAVMRDDVLRRWEATAEWIHEAGQADLTTSDMQLQQAVTAYRPVSFLLPIQP